MKPGRRLAFVATRVVKKTIVEFSIYAGSKCWAEKFKQCKAVFLKRAGLLIVKIKNKS